MSYKTNYTVSKVPIKDEYICGLVGCCFACDKSYICMWCGSTDRARRVNIFLTNPLEKTCKAFIDLGKHMVSAGSALEAFGALSFESEFTLKKNESLNIVFSKEPNNVT